MEVKKEVNSLGSWKLKRTIHNTFVPFNSHFNSHFNSRFNSHISIILLLPFLLTSCGVGKYLNDGERVLNKSSVEVVMADSTAVPKEVKAATKNADKYITQKSNRRLFGIRNNMRTYCSTSPSDTSWWGNFWRAQGEPPVVYNEQSARRSAQQIATLMRSKGCFKSTVTFDTLPVRKHEVEVRYTIHASPRYKIDEVRFRSMQQDINDLLQRWKEHTHIHVGDYYDQDVLDAERKDIASYLQRRGYYYASASLVHFMIDTTFDPRLLSILVTVRQPEVADRDGKTRRMPLQAYRIDNIYIYPNSNISLQQGARQFDTLIVPYETRLGQTQYQFIHNGPITPSPNSIVRSLYIFSGQTYRPSIVSSTSNGLLDLNNFKVVDIGFEPSPNSTDTTPLLNARIRLLNTAQRRISLSFELTNGSSSSSENNNFFTSGNIGLGQNLSYSNSNLFGNAEQLTIEENLLIETPKSVFTDKRSGFYDIFSSFELGGGATLNLPEFLLPFTKNIAWQRNKPHTLINFNIDYLYRNFRLLDEAIEIDTTFVLERIRFSSAFGYQWNQGRDKQHKLLPVNISYNHTISGAEYFLYLGIITRDVRYFFPQNYLILNTYYEFTYTNQYPGRRTNFDYLSFNVETAGNILYLADKIFGLPLGRLDDVDYYQYVRFDSEYKHYFYIGNASTFVFRTLAGIGLAYGHSSSMSYERLFYGGGPTSMRAWQIRRLGPGDDLNWDLDFPLSVGDLQLVVNLEHRFPITGPFEGALFADIGNIWAIEQIPDIPTTFAIGTGLGLRVNVSFVTIRLDAAFPLLDPGYPKGNRWLFNHFAWNKTVLNFGINYPF